MHVLVALLLLGFASACPELCICDNSEVQCRHAELTSVPEDLGDDTSVLDLSNNNITIVVDRAFASVPSLKSIIIRDSGVEVIKPEAFSGVQQLESVDLHGNRIDSPHVSIFQDNVNLLSLDLSHNLLKTFEFVLRSELKFLNLSGNLLTSISLLNFPSITSLESLILSNNDITNVTSDIFLPMINLTYLDLNYNPLEYDCDLKTLWILCRDRNIKCIVNDEESWAMLENLNCGDDEETIEEESTTSEEEFINVRSLMSENETANNEEGSGASDLDVTPNPSILDITVGVTDEPKIMEQENWIMIVIIVSAVVILLLVIASIVICIICRRKSAVNSSGNISRTVSIEYLNQDDQFNPTYKNSRSSVKKNDTARVNNYDRVMVPPNYNKTEPNREVIPLGDNTSAEVVRVPSFKTHGIATPLNLPQEIAVSSHSLPRSNPISVHEEVLRSGSLRRFPKPEQSTVPDIQIVAPMRRVPSNKRR
ncbi:hypothetical protein L9F63_007361 [Diploptera punctata]|uniref:Uncharacterized protein n=1 Tax=Diploptera punctata TaxID=6984 RepID=A0AAD7Z8N7_DIPPU|nr:hypothetical protein L9F63_007361 [Diploptera punctata]